MPRRFLALDACRGFCAIAVMLFHLDVLTHVYWWPVVRNGWVAVDFFFVLSGFVIASAYCNRLATAAGAIRFAIRRFGRLYPLHFAVLSVYVALELVRTFVWHAGGTFTDNTGLPALVQQIFLVQGFTPAHETWNYPAWSISVELWTNLAFAFLAVLLLRRLRICVALILALSAAFVTFGGYVALPISAAELDVLFDVVRSIFGFFLGYAVYLRYDYLKDRWKPLPVAELGVAALAAIVVAYADTLPSLVPPLVSALVVFVFAFEIGPLSALLRMRGCVLLGTISYSVYLTHSLYLLLLDAVTRAIAAELGLTASLSVGDSDLLVLGGPWAMDGAAFLCVAVTLGGSLLTYRYIEEPARLFFNRLAAEGAPRGFGQAIGETPAS